MSSRSSSRRAVHSLLTSSSTPTILTPESDNDGPSQESTAARPSPPHNDTREHASTSRHPYHSHASDSESEIDSPPRKSRLQRVSTMSKDYTDEEEEAVVKKLDRKLVLFLGALYMLSFLDRSNIGNARIAGLEKDLSLSSSQYDWLLTAFYMTYIAFEWMILLYRLVPAHIYISMCVLTWGLVASLQSITTSFGQLLVLRGVLGITEAAFGPGVPFYMTFFYRRSELAYRVGLQISAAPLATSFASSLAWLIVKITQDGPIAPWRALFLVEGFPSILTAIAAWYYIPDSPSTVRYLSPRERKVAVLRLQSENNSYVRQTSTSAATVAHRLNLKDVADTLLDPKSYLTALMFLSVNVSFSSLPVFLPTIINSMSFSPLASQALSAPPYLFAFVFVLIIGHYSDKVPDSRSLFLIGASLLSATSYAGIALAGALEQSLGEAGSITIRYVAVYGAAMGLFASVTLIITWTLNNQASATGKGTGLTILNLVGQCGPLIGVRLFPKSQGPFYIQGMVTCAAFMAVGVAGLSIVLRLILHKANLRNGFGEKPVDSGEYEMLASPSTTRKQEGDHDDIEEVEETLIGGRRKLHVENGGGFRFML
ncbi:hypothetical protein PV10_04968 [Exophiala mesophila]|uniref:Major facilitator superfamily (MFS) profile domain-containing protein n=1 Tax=Exophiala mesophila TaxID=212818 RepID=A0A0D1WWK6_EXOME|nr:uncharacterized protein PV10_04968 [Exophiala mesophila]KIV93780.1 hypothetical protein PV10_04968 [Exophiala mesophila]